MERHYGTMFKYLGSGLNDLDVKPTLIFASYLTLAKLLDLSKFLFPHL